MNRHMLARLFVCLTLVIGSAAVMAQQPVGEYYDTTKTLTLKGIMRANLALPPPAPMIIILEVTGVNGSKEMWILTGNPMTTLRRDGWQLIGPNATVKPREEIAVTAYLPRDTQKAVTALAASLQAMPSLRGGSPGPPSFITDIEEKRAHLAYGIEITTADGQKLRFGDSP